MSTYYCSDHYHLLSEILCRIGLALDISLFLYSFFHALNVCPVLKNVTAGR